MAATPMTGAEIIESLEILVKRHKLMQKLIENLGFWCDVMPTDTIEILKCKKEINTIVLDIINEM